MTVRSVNGPALTQVVGFNDPDPGTRTGPGAVRCVYLTNGAVLAGFTLTNGATGSYTTDDRAKCGGGVWCEGPGAMVSNCVLTANSAYYCGGGACGGTLDNCAITDNSAEAGGGVYNSTVKTARSRAIGPVAWAVGPAGPR